MGILYGPTACLAPSPATMGPMSEYAPVSYTSFTLRAVMTPSFFTPVFISMVVECLGLKAVNSSLLEQTIFTGRPVFRARTMQYGSTLTKFLAPKLPPMVMG